MKIVVLDGYTSNPGDLSWKDFEVLGNFTCYDRTMDQDIVQRIADSEVVIINKTPLKAKTLEACPSIRYIGVLATGYNTVDIEAATRAGITVCNVPEYSTSAVSQLVFAHLLNICHRIQNHSDMVHDGLWAQSKDFCFSNYPLVELSGKTMGIIGYGNIGKATAKIAQALGMNVLAYTRTPDPTLETSSLKFSSLNDLLSSSDVITLHCPLTPETRGLINTDTISQMKDGVIIINTARGPIIVENDLKTALTSGKVGAAGLDVMSKEPLPADNVLLQAPNCFITPHIAWLPKETRQRLLTTAANNLASFLKGRIQNKVN